jgi:nucleoside-diphosphate-sugar epimerase
MVLGNGLLARSFNKYRSINTFLIFASGVSNSKSCGEEDFRREQDLLAASIESNPDKRIVYFSTSSVNEPDLAATSYIRHKIRMEELIQGYAPNFNIFRLSNLAGASDNPTTLLNFLYSCIQGGRPFELWKYSERNIIDVEDVFRVVSHILDNALFLNRVVNIANETNYPIEYIVACIEAWCNKKARFREKERGGKFAIDLSEILPVYRALKIEFGETYLPHLIEKYYPRK